MGATENSGVNPRKKLFPVGALPALFFTNRVTWSQWEQCIKSSRECGLMQCTFR